MFIELLSEPTVIGAIIGAFVGAVASATFAIITEWWKFSKRKKGAYALIQSEIFYNITKLTDFRDNYVKEEFISGELDKHSGELSNFYNILGNFPLLTSENWINLINFIPSAFNKEEINKINYFYNKCYEISDIAKTLSETIPYTKLQVDGMRTTKIHWPLRTINDDRNMFRTDLNELITIGGDVKKIFR